MPLKIFKIEGSNLGKLHNHIKKTKNKNDTIMIEFLAEKDSPKISDFINQLHDLIDEAIICDISIKTKNIPICFMVAYKRYMAEDESPREVKDKIKVKACDICKYYEKCDGLFKEYVEKYGDGEIVPITEKNLITDNERCMIEILLKENNISTKRIIELKSTKEFNDICAHCTGGDDVFITGNKLVKKSIIKKSLSSEGYVWELNLTHSMITNYIKFNH